MIKVFLLLFVRKKKSFLLLASLLSAPAGAATLGGSFTLTNGDGHVVTNQDYRGKFLLVFFGCTDCPDPCPATMYKLAQALNILGAAALNLHTLFITIDPARDTSELAARYATLFSPEITGLSGTPAEIAQAEQDYHVYVAQDPRSGAFAHSSLIYLLGPTGSFLTAFPATLTAPELATRILALMTRP